VPCLIASVIAPTIAAPRIVVIELRQGWPKIHAIPLFRSPAMRIFSPGPSATDPPDTPFRLVDLIGLWPLLAGVLAYFVIAYAIDAIDHVEVTVRWGPSRLKAAARP
jgi:hypothetical protein